MTPTATTSPPPPSAHVTRTGAGRSRALLVMAVMALVAVVAACGSSDEPATLSGWVREPLPTVDTVALPDATAADAPFEFRAPEGGLLLVYFGFTFCPNMCPTTLSDVQGALGELGETADNIEVAFVTVDPDRDVGDALTGYIGFFTDGEGHALRTEDPAALQAAADAFGVEYEVAVDDEGNVDVGHTAHLYAVDDQGRLLVTWPFGVTSEALATDIAYLLSEQAVSERNAST